MAEAGAIYDRIGIDYANLRKPNPRIAAYWQRPEAYLDSRVRSAISSFWKIRNVNQAMARLASDLETGELQRRYGQLRDISELDAGYRIVVSRWANPLKRFLVGHSAKIVPNLNKSQKPIDL